MARSAVTIDLLARYHSPLLLRHMLSLQLAGRVEHTSLLQIFQQLESISDADLPLQTIKIENPPASILNCSCFIKKQEIELGEVVELELVVQLPLPVV